MVDFRNNFNIELAIPIKILTLLPKPLVKTATVFRTSLNRHAGFLLKQFHIALTQPGDNHTVRTLWHFDSWGYPVSGHQSGNRDLEYLHCWLESKLLGQSFKHISERMLRQLSCHEMNMFSGKRGIHHITSVNSKPRLAEPS